MVSLPNPHKGLLNTSRTLKLEGRSQLWKIFQRIFSYKPLSNNRTIPLFFTQVKLWLSLDFKKQNNKILSNTYIGGWRNARVFNIRWGQLENGGRFLKGIHSGRIEDKCQLISKISHLLGSEMKDTGTQGEIIHSCLFITSSSPRLKRLAHFRLM